MVLSLFLPLVKGNVRTKKKIGKKTPTNYREQERMIKVMEQLPHKKKLNRSDPGLENGTVMII